MHGKMITTPTSIADNGSPRRKALFSLGNVPESVAPGGKGRRKKARGTMIA